MRDGNKEAAKELLSTFRTLIATGLAVVLFATNTRLGIAKTGAQQTLTTTAVVLITISIISAIYNCLLIIPKLWREEDRIIYQSDVLCTSNISLWCFILGCGLLIGTAYV